MGANVHLQVKLLVAAAISGLLPVVFAHGGEDMDMSAAGAPTPDPDPDSPPTYFTYPEHRGVLYAHIILMVIGWIFMLPLGVMFSIARSRYTLALQFVFLATNAVAVVLGISYNANTPDLYPNNAHHKIGWIATWVVSAQVLISLVGRVAGVLGQPKAQPDFVKERHAFIPVSTENMAEHHQLTGYSPYSKPYRHSNDSGQGTEPRTESLRSNSGSTSGNDSPTELQDRRMSYDEDDEDLELKAVELNPPKPQSFLAKIAARISTRAWKFLLFGYNFVDRTILFLGFIALTTGIATWARFFEGHEIFGGLAHWIKGGVFFWYGLLTLGRWSGSFGELGWAWNVRPKRSSQKWRPTAEFAEGFLIFFYGSTNIFLEHLGGWGKGWSSQDLEHISITVLFIGGGVLAMLIESTSIRELLNTTVTETALSYPAHSYSEEERELVQPPRQYEFSINPIPALVIFLLGIMMSSHTQQSMISSTVHKQWGNLLSAASFSRGFTYVLLYLKPPRSVLPSRPPTELLTAFGMIAGGIIFAASSGDTVRGMVHYNLDAMFCYTITMGFVGLLMAWVITLLALKGWAVRKELGRPQSPWHDGMCLNICIRSSSITVRL